MNRLGCDEIDRIGESSTIYAGDVGNIPVVGNTTVTVVGLGFDEIDGIEEIVGIDENVGVEVGIIVGDVESVESDGEAKVGTVFTEAVGCNEAEGLDVGLFVALIDSGTDSQVGDAVNAAVGPPDSTDDGDVGTAGFGAGPPLACVAFFVVSSYPSFLERGSGQKLSYSRHSSEFRGMSSRQLVKRCSPLTGLRCAPFAERTASATSTGAWQHLAARQWRAQTSAGARITRRWPALATRRGRCL